MNFVNTNAEIKKKIQFEINFVPEIYIKKSLLKNLHERHPLSKQLKSR